MDDKFNLDPLPTDPDIYLELQPVEAAAVISEVDFEKLGSGKGRRKKLREQFSLHPKVKGKRKSLRRRLWKFSGQYQKILKKRLVKKYLMNIMKPIYLHKSCH